MADETTISTPAESTISDTSAAVEPATEIDTTTGTDTSTQEPGVTDSAAETETDTTQEVLYAGKYKTVEELEKGYKEAEKSFTKASEFEKKYNDLVKKQEQERAQQYQQALQQAQNRGFSSVEQQQINDHLNNAEFQEYWRYTTALNPDISTEVQGYLQQGYALLTQGYTKEATAYLNEAKKYYPSEVIEQIALAKSQESARLNAEYQRRAEAQQDVSMRNLADTIKANFSEFLSDLDTNTGKAEALQAFCATNSINSLEDMKTFQDIYNKIVEGAKASAIKEYEAQKVIDATKQSAQIDSGAVNAPQTDLPTYNEIANMSDEEYSAAVEKYGFSKLLQAK